MKATRAFDLLAPALLGPLFLGLLVAESVTPLRRRALPRAQRLRKNLVLAATASLPLRLLVVPLMLRVAGWAQRRRFGFLSWLPLAPVPRAVLGLVLLDGSLYGWHRLNHRVPLLWRFHAVHHADADLDVSTAVRFHFAEVTLSAGAHALQALLIAPTPRTLVLFEILMQCATLFHHSNWRLPERVERLLLWAVVTPRMHGIHHSISARETSTNFSVISSVWDRWFGTAQLDDLTQPVIGLPGVSAHQSLALGELSARRLLTTKLEAAT